MKKMWIVMAAVLMMSGALSGCAQQAKPQEAAKAETVQAEAAKSEAAQTEAGAQAEAAKPEAGAQAQIPEFTLVIEGVDGVEKFTSEDAAKLTLSQLETSVTNKNGETTVSVYSGILLKDLLESIGVKDLKQLTIEASDGYQVTYDKEMAFADDVIVGFLKDGEPLENNAVNISPAKASGKTLAKMAAKLIVE